MIEALTKELADVIYKFEGALPLSSVLGVLEVIKYYLITNTEEDEE